MRTFLEARKIRTQSCVMQDTLAYNLQFVFKIQKCHDFTTQLKPVLPSCSENQHISKFGQMTFSFSDQCTLFNWKAVMLIAYYFLYANPHTHTSAHYTHHTHTHTLHTTHTHTHTLHTHAPVSLGSGSKAMDTLRASGGTRSSPRGTRNTSGGYTVLRGSPLEPRPQPHPQVRTRGNGSVRECTSKFPRPQRE